MADTAYNMSQFRYAGTKNLCLTAQDTSIQYVDWQIETDSSPWYRDIFVKNNDGFIANTPYYLTFSLPRDLNYTLALALKFVTFASGYNYMYSEENTPFQFVRYIEVPRTANNGTTNSLVCLYKIWDDKVPSDYNYPNPKTAISIKAFSDGEYVNKTAERNLTLNKGVFYEVRLTDMPVGYIYYPGVLYHNREDDTYWMFSGSSTKQKTASHNPYGEDNILEGTNDVMLNWIWETEQTSSFTSYKLIITPRKSTFTGLILQMKRIQEDADIATGQYVNNNMDDTDTSSNGKAIYGRWIDLTQALDDGTLVKDTFKLYKMNDLNASQLNSAGNTLKRIGIWGHPELMMAIDGEEIKIGSSGYYELNDYDISTFSVAADGPNDAFILDYQYIMG